MRRVQFVVLHFLKSGDSPVSSSIQNQLSKFGNEKMLLLQEIGLRTQVKIINNCTM